MQQHTDAGMARDLPLIGLAMGRALASNSGLTTAWIPRTDIQDLSRAIVLRANEIYLGHQSPEAPYSLIVSAKESGNSDGILYVSENDLIRYRQGDRLAVLEGQRSSLESIRKSVRSVVTVDFPRETTNGLSLKDLAAAAATEVATFAGARTLDPDSHNDCASLLNSCMEALLQFYDFSSADRGRHWNSYWFSHVNAALSRLADLLKIYAAEKPGMSLTQFFRTFTFASFGLPLPKNGIQLRQSSNQLGRDINEALETWWNSESAVAMTLKIIENRNNVITPHALSDLSWAEFDEAVASGETVFAGFMSNTLGPQPDTVKAFAGLLEDEFFSPDSNARSTNFMRVFGADGESRVATSAFPNGPFVLRTELVNQQLRSEDLLLEFDTLIPVDEESISSSNLSLKLSVGGATWSAAGMTIEDGKPRLRGHFRLPASMMTASSAQTIEVDVSQADSLAGKVDPHLSCRVIFLPAAQPSLTIVALNQSGKPGKVITVETPPRPDDANPFDIPKSHERSLIFTCASSRPELDGQPWGRLFSKAGIWADEIRLVSNLEFLVDDCAFSLIPVGETEPVHSPVVAAIQKLPLTSDKPGPELSNSLIGRLETVLSRKINDISWLNAGFHIALPIENRVSFETLIASESIGIISNAETTRALEIDTNFRPSLEFLNSQVVHDFREAFRRLEIHDSLLRRGDAINGISDWPSRTSWKHLVSGHGSALEDYLSAYSEMVTQSKISQRLDDIFWASYPFSVSLWETTTTGRCKSVLLSPLHPIRLAWLANIEGVLANSDLSRGLAGPIEGWNLPLIGPSPTSASGMLAVPIDNGEGQLFIGWSLLTSASIDSAEPLVSPSRVGAFPAPGSAASGMNSASAESALRAFRRINPHLPTITIDLASMTKASRLREVDNIVLSAARDWSTSPTSEMIGGLRVWDSLNREGEAPLDDAQDISGYGGERTPLEWRRYEHDRTRTKVCNIRLLQDSGLKVRLQTVGDSNFGIVPRIPLRRFETPNVNLALDNSSVSSPTLGASMRESAFQRALCEVESANAKPAIRSTVFRSLLADASADWTVTGEGSISPSSMASLLNLENVGSQMLWEWRPPFLDSSSAEGIPLLERRPFVAVARIPEAFREQLRFLLSKAAGKEAIDDDVVRLLSRLGSSGVGLSSLLAMGGTHASGALGFFASMLLMDRISNSDADTFIIPIDACDTFLHALAGTQLSEDITRRADLLRIEIGAQGLVLAPIEIKLFGLGSDDPHPTLPKPDDARLREGLEQVATTARLLNLVKARHDQLDADLGAESSRALFANALAALVESAIKLAPHAVEDVDRLHERFEALVHGDMALSIGAPIVAYFGHRGVKSAEHKAEWHVFPSGAHPAVEGLALGIFAADVALVLQDNTVDEPQGLSVESWREMFSALRDLTIQATTQELENEDDSESEGSGATSGDANDTGAAEVAIKGKNDTSDKPITTSSTPETVLDLEFEENHTAGLLEGSRFTVGETLSSIRPINVDFWPGNTKLNQMNVGVVGDLGTGKTQLLKTLISELRRTAKESQPNPLSFLIFDYKDDYSKQEFLDDVNGVVLTPSEIPLNVFAIHGEYTKQIAYKRAQAFVDVLSKIYSNIGPIQITNLVETIMEEFENRRGEAPTMKSVLDAYRTKIGTVDSVVATLNKFVLQEIFSEDRESLMTLGELLDDKVLVINLKELGADNATKNALVVLLLDLYLEYMLGLPRWPYQGHDPQIRRLNSFLLVDEATNIMKFEFDVLMQLMLQGREFGLGVILASQYLSHFKAGQVNYGEPLRSWFIHKVPQVTEAQLLSLGIAGASAEVARRISSLENHEAYYSSLDHEGELIRGRPYFELKRPE